MSGDHNTNCSANKLANALEKANHSGYNLDAATMLRQQQAEIEALRMMLANRNDALDKLDLK